MQYVIKRVTTETFAVDAEDATEAKTKMDGAARISIDERVSVDPRGVSGGGSSTTNRPPGTVTHQAGPPPPKA